MFVDLVEKSYVYVQFNDSDIIHAVITPEYYDVLKDRIHTAPPGIYEDAMYTKFYSPFTFTTLNAHLPFKYVSVGGFKLQAKSDSIRENAIVEFHQGCLAVYRQFLLSPTGLWFDYMNDNKEYSLYFKDLYDRFTKNCILTA